MMGTKKVGEKKDVMIENRLLYLGVIFGCSSFINGESK